MLACNKNVLSIYALMKAYSPPSMIRMEVSETTARTHYLAREIEILVSKTISKEEKTY